MSLHGAAGRLMERVYRESAKPQDGREALDLYRAASVLEQAEGCAYALHAARFAGELEADVAVSYTELYRLSKRDPKSPQTAPCFHEVATTLERLASFRPPSAVLDAIEHNLAASGGAGPLAELPDASAPQGNRLLRVEKWVGPDGARVVLFLRRPAPFRVGDESTPWGTTRTYVEIEGIPPDPLDVTTVGIVTKIHSEPSQGGAKVSLELDGKGFRKVFHLPEPYRIVIDIARRPPSSSRAVSRVVLDPGHGGNDPGATSADGIHEKDVTLAIAHKVAPILARDGVSVVLTRDADQYVTLEERTARANASGADLFISLHCNAAENRARRGIETYVLDTSNSDMASRLAARENATSPEATRELSSILASMRMADQAERSTHFAQLLQKAAITAVRPLVADVVNGGVHNAGFYVLVGARMPGVLFEASYLSHPEEGAWLAKPDYQARIADGIANAIRAYREGR
jgi:N-acetylmuramoyl-L-alanine amidase